MLQKKAYSAIYNALFMPEKLMSYLQKLDGMLPTLPVMRPCVIVQMPLYKYTFNITKYSLTNIISYNLRRLNIRPMTEYFHR